MEQLLLIFFRNALAQNPELKRTMQNFLRFYKENRELIIAVLAMQTGEKIPEACPPPAPVAEEKSRPCEVDSKKVLEEYLARVSL